MRLGHEPRTKSQLDVIDPFAFRVFDTFPRDTLASIGVTQHRSHPKHFRDECHHAGLSLHDLHMRPQFLQRCSGQFHAVLFSEFENGCQPHAAIDVPMQLD